MMSSLWEVALVEERLQRLCELWKDQGAKKIGILEIGDKLFHSHSLNIPTQNVNTARDELLPDNSTLSVNVYLNFQVLEWFTPLGEGHYFGMLRLQADSRETQ